MESNKNSLPPESPENQNNPIEANESAENNAISQDSVALRGLSRIIAEIKLNRAQKSIDKIDERSNTAEYLLIKGTPTHLKSTDFKERSAAVTSRHDALHNGDQTSLRPTSKLQRFRQHRSEAKLRSNMRYAVQNRGIELSLGKELEESGGNQGLTGKEKRTVKRMKNTHAKNSRRMSRNIGAVEQKADQNDFIGKRLTQKRERLKTKKKELEVKHGKRSSKSYKEAEALTETNWKLGDYTEKRDNPINFSKTERALSSVVERGLDKPLNVESIKEILKGFGDQSALLSKFVFNKLQSAGLIDKDGQLIGSPELVQEFIETHSLPSQFSEQAHSDESTDNESNATNSASEHNETKNDTTNSAPVIVQGEVLAATTENSDKDTTSEDAVSVSLISSAEVQEIYDRFNIVEDSEIEDDDESTENSSEENSRQEHANEESEAATIKATLTAQEYMAIEADIDRLSEKFIKSASRELPEGQALDSATRYELLEKAKLTVIRGRANMLFDKNGSDNKSAAYKSYVLSMIKAYNSFEPQE